MMQLLVILHKEMAIEYKYTFFRISHKFVAYFFCGHREYSLPL